MPQPPAEGEMQVMATDRFYSSMVIFLLVLLGYLSYRIMSPFLASIAWAIVFSIVFYPVYAYLSRYIRIKSVASIITIILILIIIIGPFTYLTFVLIDELQSFAEKINGNSPGTMKELIDKVRSSVIFERLTSYAGFRDFMSEEAIMENIKKIGKGLIENLTIRITNIISAAIDFIFMIFTTFFLLKDGPGFLSKTKDYMPFSNTQKDKLASQVKDTIVSTVYGGVVVAVIQGILGGLVFYFIGIESPVMWGVAMSIMSFVPLVGTFAIWGPTSAFLVIQGSYIKGIGLFVFGIFVISMVDNVLKPLIIGSRTKMHTIIILFSVLGGIKLFGMIGLIMGPLIMAIFVSVFEIFRNIEGGVNA